MARPVLSLLCVLSLALGACKTPEQKLVDTRRELRATLDRVYADYSARGAKPKEDAEPGVLGHVAGQVDRAYFESQCLALGRGERGFNLSPRLEAFLAEERNADACREAADLQLEIDALEQKVSRERGG
jgi:hypothetical protein